MEKTKQVNLTFFKTLVCVCSVALLSATSAVGQFEFENAPISYNDAEVSDAIFQLKQKLVQGSANLEWDDRRGWLPSLLDQLEISDSSQLLVFTKTSLQLNKISPGNPRAVYFNDDTYVGFVPGGDIIELSAVDPKLGAVFYSIEQNADRSMISRDRSQCMTCHGTNKTQDVPGYLVRSVYPSGSGHPRYEMGTVTTDHRTDFRKRFGGWYVLGKHGDMRHRGNVIASKTQPAIDFEKGANLTELPARIKSKNYMNGSSDLVALMVLEHQTQMHNWITKASYETRLALNYQLEMNKIFDRDRNFQIESTTRRIESSAEDLLEYMLFCDEYQLDSPIAHATPFANQFERLGPRDDAQRSLREFDLTNRMFRYPCSYLIYSESFDNLPEPVLSYLARRLGAILSGKDQSRTFSHLTADDRLAIQQILMQTKPRFAKRWIKK